MSLLNALLRKPSRGKALHVLIPTGALLGWGVCGKYLIKEFSRRCPVKLISAANYYAEGVSDPFELEMLAACHVDPGEYEAIRDGRSVDAPVLHAIGDEALRPMFFPLRGTVTQGYTFFERNVLPPDAVKNARDHFDQVITGSTWCEEVLREHGLTEVRTILQGVDPSMFHPCGVGKEYLRDKFVVFSGGKLELRKGQDIVIRAYKTLQDRHADVMLVNSWFNCYPASMQSMSSSSLIRYSPFSGDYQDGMTKVLADNGLDVRRVMTLPVMPNVNMPHIYRNTDIGLFPNRCEGGTNLVMMEYMACGRPVLASFNSGHRDVLSEQNSLRILASRKLEIADKSTLLAVWDDPDLEEVTEKLEWAYQNRDSIRNIGARAASDMAQLTWERTAEQFLQALGVAAA